MSPVLSVVLRILGSGALLAGGLALAALIAVILLGPLIFGLPGSAHFASAVGLPSGLLGHPFRDAVPFHRLFGKVVIAAIVFLVDPSWFHGVLRCTGRSHAYVPNFVAFALLALLLSRLHAHAQKSKRKRLKKS